MSPKKILYVVNEARWFVTHRLPVARAAEQAGFEIHVATPPGPFVDAIREAGFAWHEARFQRGSLHPVAEVRTFVNFIRLYRRVKPDLVHHVSAKPVLYGTLAARIARVPAIVDAITGFGHLFLTRDLKHTTIRILVGLGYRVILRHRRLRVIFQNADDRDHFVSRGWTRAADSVLIASGVDVETYCPKRVQDGGPPVVVLPARLIFTKGVGEFVRAAEQLKRDGVRARFVLVGDVDPQNPASVAPAQVDDWVKSGTIEWWGERHDMPAVYAQADIVCLPSYREGMPKVLIEAASCGLPAVTTDTPGCRDVVRDNDNGFLVPVGDTDLLAKRLRQLIEDPGLRARMGARGRQRVLDEFSSANYARQTLALYDALVAKE